MQQQPALRFGSYAAALEEVGATAVAAAVQVRCACARRLCTDNVHKNWVNAGAARACTLHVCRSTSCHLNIHTHTRSHTHTHIHTHFHTITHIHTHTTHAHPTQYAEGVAFKVYLEEGRLVSRGELPLVELEEYLGGVLDMTGELNRYAIAQARGGWCARVGVGWVGCVHGLAWVAHVRVHAYSRVYVMTALLAPQATKRNTPAVAACRDLVEGLMGHLLQVGVAQPESGRAAPTHMRL